MYKITMLFMFPVLVAYAQYLKEERIKAQQYVDRLNSLRNIVRCEDRSGSQQFKRDWYEYEEEYQYNWGD